ncbi:MAG: DNA repair helicase XPB [Candidatus Omnitrophota bacterium]
MSSNKPLIVQSDKTVFLDVDSDGYEEARDILGAFAELIKCPEHIHTYVITPLSLWNAASAGLTAEEVVQNLEKHSRYAIPGNVKVDIVEYMGRYGRLLLEKENGRLLLRSQDSSLLDEIVRHKKTQPYIGERLNAHTVEIGGDYRGHLKQNLLKIGFPVKDLAGYVEGSPLDITLREQTLGGRPFYLRDYQRSAVSVFYRGGGADGGSGAIVLPCGAGKTIIGLGVMAEMKRQTLILVTNIVALRQWRREILDKTYLDESAVCEYSGECKEIGPITLATYQILTFRKNKEEDFPHLKVFEAQDWGLIIYDEVHLLPAPVFRITADIQARRRLGLTATLIREDGLETDVFSLIGPKCYDVPWKVLEKQGWIATAECHEIRTPMAPELRHEYVVSPPREQYRIASENPLKLDVLEKLLYRHKDDRVLVIGQYLRQLKIVASVFHLPLITGQTPNLEREKLYARFRTGEIGGLVVSKVANFAVDLPEANIAIQISGSFGSRQEEAQRLGRILRPKAEGAIAHFYTIVTRDSNEGEFAQKRQRFLAEQGYQYSIQNMEDDRGLANRILTIVPGRAS